jgi:hypothetical protein
MPGKVLFSSLGLRIAIQLFILKFFYLFSDLILILVPKTKSPIKISCITRHILTAKNSFSDHCTY